MSMNLFDFLQTSGSAFEEVEFSGWEVIRYYFFLFQNKFVGYSWQIITAYHISMGCILVLIALFIMFFIRLSKRKRNKRKAEKITNKYLDSVRTILGSDTMSFAEMKEILGVTDEEIRKNKPQFYIVLLEKARMEMYEIVYLPNMQNLAVLLGVRDLFENNLLLNKDVFRTLQVMAMLQIVVSEGRLANYVNHNNKKIRMMARICFITCSSTNEPYRFLIEDLNQPQALYLPMLLHYVFGWMKSKELPMPNFLVTSDRVKNEEMAAYLIEEVTYWGSDIEKNSIPEHFLSDRMICRSAAINVATALCDPAMEEKLIETYDKQPEQIRRQIMSAVLSMKSGKQLDFFINVYNNTSSRQTRETALYCIYNYNSEGRRLFEMFRNEADEESRTLFEQIDSAMLLGQLQQLG